MRHLLLIPFKGRKNLRKFFSRLLLIYNFVQCCILDFTYFGQFNFHRIAFSIYLPPTLCRIIAAYLRWKVNDTISQLRSQASIIMRARAAYDSCVNFIVIAPPLPTNVPQTALSDTRERLREVRVCEGGGGGSHKGGTRVISWWRAYHFERLENRERN